MSSDPKVYRVSPASRSPDTALPVDDEFREQFDARVAQGREIARRSSVCFVGMARDIAGVLPFSIQRIEQMGALFDRWTAVVVENDSRDATKEVLHEWSVRQRNVCVDSQNLGRERLAGFEPLRVQRYAEYRTRYRDIAAATRDRPDYVVAVDFDPWGGWSVEGLLNGIAWMDVMPSAAGMASVSLYEQPWQAPDKDGEAASLLCHYDQWAWRWQGWKQRMEPWFSLWLPPPGSPPIRCKSAFGALCIYRPAPFFECAPVSIDGDIEHVGLHKQMASRGWEFFINPSQRTLMHWIPSESDVIG